VARNEPSKLTLERTFNAQVEDVWELWTTKEGIESWWGPEGFEVTVYDIDLRPGGELVYAMSAIGRDQIEYMKKAGMPLTTEHHITYTEVDSPRRLAYRSVVDFVPGVEPYEVEASVELHGGPDGTRMFLTFDAMHDDQWTKMAVLGRESELGRLERALAARYI
jgi:uncharacterized protein YndB with AHSA1/START domain